MMTMTVTVTVKKKNSAVRKEWQKKSRERAKRSSYIVHLHRIQITPSRPTESLLQDPLSVMICQLLQGTQM